MIQQAWGLGIDSTSNQLSKSQQLGRVVDCSQLRNWWLSDKHFPKVAQKSHFSGMDAPGCHVLGPPSTLRDSDMVDTYKDAEERLLFPAARLHTMDSISCQAPVQYKF
uniref:Uncharacterized protein n=1 Tax=Coccidioides posadasii RMSCC 3488 TaxID=454284 RepID=A0A0J6FPH9_COCPO|nr:hypothetical protein CPAG_08575 [Coccidioides posadasii RMSCC 3488]